MGWDWVGLVGWVSGDENMKVTGKSSSLESGHVINGALSLLQAY